MRSRGCNSGTSSIEAQDPARAETVKESTKMAEEPAVASQGEPSGPRLEDL